MGDEGCSPLSHGRVGNAAVASVSHGCNDVCTFRAVLTEAKAHTMVGTLRVAAVPAYLMGRLK